MTKLAVIFEVPDGSDYADVASRMITHHAFAEQQQIRHWSFNLEMRPTAAIQLDVDQQLADTATAARDAIDQDHPWIPGAVFQDDDRLKPLLLAFLDSLVPAAAPKTEHCGRCNKEVPVGEIQVTGPYRACGPCTHVIRN